MAATVAVPGVARGAAALCWVYAAGFGLPALPIATYALQARALPWLGDLFPMYGGPWWDAMDPEAFAATLVVYAGVTVAVAWSGWLLWRGRRSGAVLALAAIPFEAVFWYGYALPIPPALALLRVGLIAAAWPRLRS
jgi:hypothetical protein